MKCQALLTPTQPCDQEATAAILSSPPRLCCELHREHIGAWLEDEVELRKLSPELLREWHRVCEEHARRLGVFYQHSKRAYLAATARANRAGDLIK